jgi:hypothetical protein
MEKTHEIPEKSPNAIAVLIPQRKLAVEDSPQ